MGYFDSVKAEKKKAERPPADVISIVRQEIAGVHPYARAVISAELARLDQCHTTPEGHAPRWDDTTYEVACNLIEIANSPWSGYTHAQARQDYDSHAPRDAGFDQRRIDQKWASAEGKVGSMGRPEPTNDLQAVPSPTVLERSALESAVAADIAAGGTGDVDISAIIRQKFPVLDWHELWNTEDEEDEWIVEPILPARRLVALFSAPKVGKSLLMLEIAVAVARGQEVLGVTPERPRKVLYVDFENDPRGDVRERLRAMGIRPQHLDNLCYLSYPTLAKLDTHTGAMELMAIVAEYDCEVVVIDTISRAVGGEENENDTWLAFYRNTGLAMKQAGVACIRLDHTGKDHDKGMRGGSAKYGDVDAVWKLSKVTEETYRLDCTDHRMRISEPTIVVTREQTPFLRHKVEGEGRMAAFNAKVAEIVTVLDAAGAANDLGRDGARAVLKERGITARNEPLGEAIRQRKNRLGYAAQEEL